MIDFEQAANRFAPAEHVAVLAAGSVRPGSTGSFAVTTHSC